MTPSQLHAKLMEACENENLDEVKKWLDLGADPNFMLNRPINALEEAIELDHYPMLKLLLEYGAEVKVFVLQKAIQKDKNYLQMLVPAFTSCRDEKLLMGVLQAGINIDDVDLAKQAIEQGAKVESLFISSIFGLSSIAILQLLLENGFNIHADKNLILTQWMGSTVLSGWGDSKHERHDLLAFISAYYLEKPGSVEKFKSLRLPDKSLLFRIGLDSNDVKMMKFSILIGVSKNKVLNAALYRYYENKDDKSAYEIIQYILNLEMEFESISISNAVCFKYVELLNALSRMEDLEYGYEMAYKYEDDVLCEYFIDKGVSKEAQNMAKVRVSAIKGNIKDLRQAINSGVDLGDIGAGTIIEIINENKSESLKCLYDAGMLLDSAINLHLDKAMNQYKAYETIAYFIEVGLDITHVKNMPRKFRVKYPAMADMFEKRFRNIFDYTVYLAREVYPKVEGKEKENTLQSIAELSTLPYVIRRSQ